MADRKKLELNLNQPTQIELLFDKPTTGTSQFGEYYLYAVRNGDGSTEYSFFAPPEVHEKLKDHKKGSKAIITKSAVQKGSKILTNWDVQVQEVKVSTSDIAVNGKDTYFEAMLSSYEEALKIQEKFNGLIDVNRVAITLYISKVKIGSNGFGG